LTLTYFHIIISINQARGLAPATIVNPNLHGPRDIDFLVDEVVQYRINNGLATYPSDRLRLQGLINLSLKNSVSEEERNYTMESPMVQEMYRAMKKMVLPFHTAFMEEYWATQGGDASGALPNWSDIDATLKLKHFLLLEGDMRKYGHILYRCKNNWASDRLFYQAHKSRRDRSLARARGSAGSSSTALGSSCSSFSVASGAANEVSSVAGDEGNEEDYDEDDDSSFGLLSNRPSYIAPRFPLPRGGVDAITAERNDSYRLEN
jgi:hypothetical protein